MEVGFFTRRDIKECFTVIIMTEEKRKIKSNTEDEYNKALALDDPTKISKEAQETLAREAIKKFKSL
ncbi:hypothetical protein DYY67_0259 [Candidatus Nitrosotalea sp. TS]|uniref:hypothetical protein n=1 Tax=Candidatus Nitrosotalea sp. TS TaxID=2341020 RepID=UPI00140BA6BD|nr:hypothetical protein [Candidatus Nitrosotalea sp. TS]NHI03138.1 hypothetical protein [Candidatus Nitrosotalea sp. TS]